LDRKMPDYLNIFISFLENESLIGRGVDRGRTFNLRVGAKYWGCWGFPDKLLNREREGIKI